MGWALVLDPVGRNLFPTAPAEAGGRRDMSLEADGVSPVVCPVSDDSDLAGLAIFDAPPDDVAKIMDGDPGVRAGIFSYEIHPVRGFPGSSLPG